MKRIVPFLLLTCCFSISHATPYENGGTLSEYYGGFIETWSGTLIVTGQGGAGAIDMYNNSHLEVQSTSSLSSSGGIWDIRLGGHSRLDYYGGWTDEVSMRNYSTAKLYGGRIDFISSYQAVDFLGWDPQGNEIYDKHIEMFVRDYQFNPTTMRITGTWEDYTTFNIKLLDQSSDPRYDPAFNNIKFTIVPEPASLMLLAFGGFLLRKQRITN